MPVDRVAPLQVAEAIGYELASRQGERQPPAQKPKPRDISESEGRAALRAAQREHVSATGKLADAPVAPMPSCAEILQETPAGGGAALAGGGVAGAQEAGDRVRAAGDYGGVLDQLKESATVAAMEGLNAEEARAVQQSQARGALRQELRRKLDLNLRDVDVGGGPMRGTEESGWGYGSDPAIARTLLTQAELENLLADSDDCADSL